MLTLKVPYSEKDQAKALGARWDAGRKTWYVPDGQQAAPFERWIVAGSDFDSPRPAQQKSNPGRVDSFAGKPVTGAHYFDLGHDCDPFQECDQCKPKLEASGWAAARRASLLAFEARERT